MAQPNTNGVYDPEEDKKTLSAEERAHRAWGMSDSSDEEADNPVSAVDRAKKRWGVDPNTEKPTDSSVAEKEAEASTDDGQADAGLSNKEKSFSYRRTTGKSKKVSNKKKWLFGLGGVGLIGGTLGVAFIMPALALKVMTTKLTETFTDRIDYAINERMDRLVEGYFSKFLSPASTTRCGTVITSECSVFDPGKGVAGNLYKNWKNNRIEQKLFDKHGITFERSTKNNQRITVFKTNSFGIKGEVGEFGDRTVSKEVSRLIRQTDQTSGVLARWKYRSLISNKYGGKAWCLIACDKRDNIDTRLNPIQRLQYKFITRVAEPINSKTAAYMFCLLNSCDADKLKREVSEAARDAIAKIGSENLEELGEKLGDKTISQYLKERLTAQILEKVLGFASKEAANTAAKAVPVIGWVYFAITVVDQLDQFDKQINNGVIEQFARDLRAEASISYAFDWQTVSDDIWSLDAPLTDVAAANSMVYGFNQSRVYQAASGKTPNAVNECEDGVVLSEPDDPLACPEMSMNPGSKIDDYWNIIKNFPGTNIGPTLKLYNQCLVGVPFTSICAPKARVQSIVHPVLKGIGWAIGGLGSLAFGAANAITFGTLDRIGNALGDKAVDVLSWIGEKIFGTGIDTIATGAKLASQVGAGLDTFANIFLKGETIDGDSYGLGARKVTEQEEGELQVAIAERKAEEIQNSGAFARYFDIQNPDSLLATSVGGVGGGTSISNTSGLAGIFNPFSQLALVADTLSNSGKASAITASTRQDIYNNTQYAYPANAAEFDIDPDTLTSEKCSEYAQIRESTKTIDPDTKETIYTATNPCELEQTIVDVLTKVDDLDPEGSTGGGGPGVPVAGVNCNGYTKTSLSGNVEQTYNGAIKTECEKLVNECASVGAADTKKIVCEALNFDGTYYGNSYGSYSGAKANQIYGFTASSGNYGIGAESWLANRSEGLSPNNLLECSGLTSVALYNAFDFDGANIGCSGNWTERNNPSLFRQIEPSEIRPGDFLTKTFGCNSGGSGHIAIAASTVDANGNIIVYETNSWGLPARFTQKNLASNFPAGRSRYIGPGAEQ